MEQINLNLIPGRALPVCHVSQYDVGRTIRFNLFEGDQVFALATGDTAEVHVRKPDGTVVTAALTVVDAQTYIEVTTTQQMDAVAGSNLCEIQLKRSGKTLGTLNFIMEVEPDPMTGGVASDSVIKDLESQVGYYVGQQLLAQDDIDGKAFRYYTQYLMSSIKEEGKYYVYNAGTITKQSNANLCCFKFDIAPGNYYYYRLYGSSCMVYDKVAQTFTQLTASSYGTYTAANESTCYINVNLSYVSEAYFSDFDIYKTPTMPDGVFCLMLAPELISYLMEGEKHTYKFMSNGYISHYYRTIYTGDAFTFKFETGTDSTVTMNVDGMLSGGTYEQLAKEVPLGGFAYFKAKSDYIGLRITVSTPASSGTFSIIAHTETAEAMRGKVFYCGPTRELSTLKAGIETATQYMDSILYVDPGTYDLVQEFGTTWFDNLTSLWTLVGLRLKNNIHIIFSPNSKVISHYTGSNEYAQSLYSPFNAVDYGFTIENLTLECSRCRYAVHDERNGHTEQYKAHYINCSMKIDNSENDYWTSRYCIGGGLGSNAEVIVEGCTFETDDANNVGAVYYHQSNDLSNDNYKSKIIVRDNYFVTGAVQVNDSRSGGSTSGITTYLITNNSFPKKYGSTDDEGVRINNSSPTTVVYDWNNKIRS